MPRPWYSAYPESVPHEVSVPDYSLYELLTRTAEKYPDQKALIDGDREFTYEELRRQVDRLATSLKKRGFQKGDRMAIMLPNSIEYVMSYFAVHRLGGTICQVNPMYQLRELDYILQNSEAKWFISFEEQWPKVDKVERSESLIVISADLESEHPNHLYKWLDEEDEIVPPEVIVPREDVALLQYTGGTTGRSKGVVLTHANLITNVTQSVTFQQDILRIPGEVMVGSSPLFHIAGIVNLNQAILTGAVYIAVRRVQIDDMLALIRKYRPTIFSGVPTLYIALLNHPELQSDDLKSFKVCASGTAALPMEVINGIEEKTGAQVISSFGMSEALITHRTPLGKTKKLGSIGVPLPGTDAKIVDIATGKIALPIGEAGEMILKGPQVMGRYWKNPEETDHALRDGWLYTGDLATMDEDGYFSIVGRKKDMIIASGYNIYPDEVEEVLYQHPAVADACAHGAPDPYRGETVKVVIVPKRDVQVSEEEIVDWCNERLARYKVPTIIEFRDELPRSAVGKVLRRVLVEEEKAKAITARSR